MNKRIVMCTSTGCLDYAPEKLKNHGIDLIRVHIHFMDKEYLEGVGFKPEDFYSQMENVKEVKAGETLPHSSMPTREEISKHFEDAIAAGYDEAIVISLSSYLGGTWNFIRIVAKDYADKLKVTVIDTKIVGWQEGQLALKAKELVDKGVPTKEICQELQWMRNGMKFSGVAARLDYMILNGRLKGGKAYLGKLMHICPVVWFNEAGELTSLTTAMGTNKALQKCIEQTKEWIGDRKPEDYCLFRVYTGTSLVEKAKKLCELSGLVPNHEPMILSCVTGVHVGPWVLGYCLTPIRRPDEPLPPVPDYYFEQHPEEK